MEKFYLITYTTFKGKIGNLCVTNMLNHAKKVCMEYSDLGAKYKQISDIEALHILSTDMACLNAIRL